MSSDPRASGGAGRTSWITHVLVAIGVLAVVLLGGSSVAAAHVSLVASDPQNVSTVAGPVTEVRLTFSAQAQAVDDEFSVVAASGEQVAIERVRSDGDEVLVVSLAEPLPVGRTRLTWAIRSGDSHTMTGSVSFTVTAAASDAAPVAGSATPGAAAPAGSEPQVERTLSDGGATPARTLADHLATASRWLVYGAAFVCVGGLAYLAFVHRGSAAECRRLVFHVRRAALVVMVASVAEWLFQVVAFSRGSPWTVASPGAWADLLGTGFATGTALRLVGAALVLAFARNEVDRCDADGDRRDDPLERLLGDPLARPGPGVVATAARAAPLARSRVEASTGAVVGAVLLVVSEAFIGHTATVGPRLAVLLSDAGHMVAAAAWSSGALMLTLTLVGRRRRGRPLDARLLAARFSVMATWCLAVVAVTGMVLAWSILDGPGALWSTEFGRILLVKLVGVAVLVGAGAYNHLVLVPGIDRGDRGVEQRFTRAISIEVGVFAAVLAVTALLVVSSPT